MAFHGMEWHSMIQTKLVHSKCRTAQLTQLRDGVRDNTSLALPGLHSSCLATTPALPVSAAAPA